MAEQGWDLDTIRRRGRDLYGAVTQAGSDIGAVVAVAREVGEAVGILDDKDPLPTGHGPVSGTGTREDPFVMAETTVEATGGGGVPSGLPVGAIISYRGRRWKVQADGSVLPYQRRRRRRMLTCSDRADIGFLVATLGKGQTGASAVQGILSGCRR